MKVLIALIFGLWCLSPVWAIDIAEIQAEIEARHRAITDLHAEYVVIYPGQRDYSRHVFAAKGKDRYTENVHAYGEVPEEFDLNHHKTWLTDSGLDLFYVNSRFFERTKIIADSETSLKVRAPVIVEVLGWWPADDEVPVTSLLTLPMISIFRHKTFVVQEEADSIDQVPCIRIQASDGEILWIDPAKGFAVIKRSVPLHDTITDYTFEDFKRVHGDTYFPTSCRRMTRQIEGTKESIQEDFHYRITSLSVNSLPDTFFDFDPPPGTLIEFIDEQRRVQVPGGREVLGNVVQATLVNLKARNQRIEVPATGLSTSMAMLLGGLIVVVALLLDSTLRRKASHAKCESAVSPSTLTREQCHEG